MIRVYILLDILYEVMGNLEVIGSVCHMHAYNHYLTFPHSPTGIHL